jgi:hypothetical protein
MNVRIDHIEDANAGPTCGVEIGFDRKDRVDNSGGGLAAAAEKIGRSDGIQVKKLPQDHDGSPDNGIAWGSDHSAGCGRARRE